MDDNSITVGGGTLLLQVDKPVPMSFDVLWLSFVAIEPFTSICAETRQLLF